MSESVSGDALRGHLETMLLSILSERDSHGFELLKQLAERGEGAFHLKEGTVYPVLYRLERAGQITARWEDGKSDRRGPRRRVYRLTAKGRRTLETARQQWSRFVSVVGNIIAPAALNRTPRPHWA